jgi:hypothetical protein
MRRGGLSSLLGGPAVHRQFFRGGAGGDNTATKGDTGAETPTGGSTKLEQDTNNNQLQQQQKKNPPSPTQSNSSQSNNAKLKKQK